MSAPIFPTDLSSYPSSQGLGILETLKGRVEHDPVNLVASVIFLFAIIHTFVAYKFRHMAHEAEEAHAKKLQARRAASTDENEDGHPDEVSFKGQVLHFFGEVEAVFGIWVLVLMGALIWFKGGQTAIDYVGYKVVFTEPLFVVVIMALASTRPILQFAEKCLRVIARIGGGTVGAWWLALLIVAPLLGSFITEPGAMTIAAMLLARQFYEYKPSSKLAYGTIGLLFVNVSVGGTLTHFAAPPVLMVASKWGWDTPFMLRNFGSEAVLGITVSSVLYYIFFRKEFGVMEKTRLAARAAAAGTQTEKSIPAWITLVHIGFMGWTVAMAHYPVLFIGGFLFFMAFSQATAHHQGKLDLRPSMMVGFFLAGLVVHGGLQAWWIEPVLSRLGEVPLFIGATVLTAFNDNAAITYLASLVPGFTDELKHAVVAGAVTGGGLTVIANAPNPAGQSILQRFFPGGVSPLGLFLGALPPTIILSLAFMVW